MLLSVALGLGRTQLMIIILCRELRKTVGSLESVLRVNSPQVHMRLSGRPSSLVSVQSQPHLRYVFSFFSKFISKIYC